MMKQVNLKVSSHYCKMTAVKESYSVLNKQAGAEDKIALYKENRM